MAALDLAATRIEAFHAARCRPICGSRTTAGVTLGMRWTPLDAVGLYVPGGKAAYPSSVLMNAIPARVAGVHAHRHVRADAGRRAESAGACRGPPCRGGRDLPDRRRAGDRRAGLRHRHASPRSTASSAPATPMSPRPSGRCSAVSASTPSPARRRSSCWPTPPTIRAAIAVDLLAQAEHDEAAQAILITDDARVRRRGRRGGDAASWRPCRAPRSPARAGRRTARSSWCATGTRRSVWSTAWHRSTCN